MRNYSTQMEAARKGIITPELEIVAKKERMTTEELLPLVASGKVAICANKNHKCIDPEGVGSMLRTKINVNLGVSRDCKDYDVEMQKVMEAVNMGAHAIMDLSSHGNTIPFRRKLTSECPRNRRSLRNHVVRSDRKLPPSSYPRPACNDKNRNTAALLEPRAKQQEQIEAEQKRAVRRKHSREAR